MSINNNSSGSKNRDTSFHQDNSFKSTENVRNHDPKDERLSIIDYLKQCKSEIADRYANQRVSAKRPARFYFINKNESVLVILQGDIVRTKIDAIVNAANEHMTGGGGVDGIIHRAAGNKLHEACVAHKKVSPGTRLPTGHSRILLSYNMSSTTHYIINTAGPIYSHYAADRCAQQLFSCYQTALQLANLYDLESIGFTAISCGIFGYPADDGAKVALKAADANADLLRLVVFVLWDDHIYDAWVRCAEKLNFPSFDLKNITNTSSSFAIDKVPEPTTTKDDAERSQSSSTKVDEVAETETDRQLNEAVRRLPSVPRDPSKIDNRNAIEDTGDNKEPKSSVQSQNTDIAEPKSSENSETAITPEKNESPVETDKSYSETPQVIKNDHDKELSTTKAVDTPANSQQKKIETH